MKHACFLAAAAAVALLALAAPANATHTENGLACDDSIETSNTTLTLTADLVCGQGNQYGLLIAADNVTINLAGHAVHGPRPTFNGNFEGVAAIVTASAVSGTEIRGGSGGTGLIDGFYNGVQLTGSDALVKGLGITVENNAVNVLGDGAEVALNTLQATVPGGGSVLGVFGDNAHVHRNVVTGVGYIAIQVAADLDPEGAQDAVSPRVAVNTVQCSPSDFGTPYAILVSGYSGRAIVARNTITDCIGTGINIASPTSSGGTFQVRRNQANGNTDGIHVSEAPGSRVWCNEANGNSGNGILVDGTGTRVDANRANDNTIGYGIYANGATDGGGNTATGNADDCFGVVCGPPPDPPCPAAGSGA